MGSRTMPTECHHGVTIDWGDFGPCQDCKDHDWSEDCPNFEECERCTTEHAKREAALWFVFDEAIRGFLMERHLPFDELDPWTAEIVAITREHFATDRVVSPVDSSSRRSSRQTRA